MHIDANIYIYIIICIYIYMHIKLLNTYTAHTHDSTFKAPKTCPSVLKVYDWYSSKITWLNSTSFTLSAGYEGHGCLA